MSSTISGGTGKVPGYNVSQIPQFTPEMMQLFKSLFSHVGPDSFLSKIAGGDEAAFNQMEAPALRQFSGLQGNLASRFSGMGMGSRHSSGFQNTSNAAASDFAQQLQSRRMDLQSQALKDLFGLSGSLLSKKPYETALTEEPMSFWKQFLIALAPGLGQGASMAMGGL